MNFTDNRNLIEPHPELIRSKCRVKATVIKLSRFAFIIRFSVHLTAKRALYRSTEPLPMNGLLKAFRFKIYVTLSRWSEHISLHPASSLVRFKLNDKKNSTQCDPHKNVELRLAKREWVWRCVKIGNRKFSVFVMRKAPSTKKISIECQTAGTFSLFNFYLFNLFPRRLPFRFAIQRGNVDGHDCSIYILFCRAINAQEKEKLRSSRRFICRTQARVMTRVHSAE